MHYDFLSTFSVTPLSFTNGCFISDFFSFKCTFMHWTRTENSLREFLCRYRMRKFLDKNRKVIDADIKLVCTLSLPFWIPQCQLSADKQTIVLLFLTSSLSKNMSVALFIRANLYCKPLHHTKTCGLISSCKALLLCFWARYILCNRKSHYSFRIGLKIFFLLERISENLCHYFHVSCLSQGSPSLTKVSYWKFIFKQDNIFKVLGHVVISDHQHVFFDLTPCGSPHMGVGGMTVFTFHFCLSRWPSSYLK